VGATHDLVHFSVERCHGPKKSNRCGNGEEHVESERLAMDFLGRSGCDGCLCAQPITNKGSHRDDSV
jgi:hypothetical protein